VPSLVVMVGMQAPVKGVATVPIRAYLSYRNRPYCGHAAIAVIVSLDPQ
jgi:hypothetical protein